MNAVFHTAPIDGRSWLRILAVALVASLVVGLEKRLRRDSASPASAGRPRHPVRDPS